MRSMITEQERMQREKKQILTDLQRTESVSVDHNKKKVVVVIELSRCRTWMMLGNNFKG